MRHTSFTCLLVIAMAFISTACSSGGSDDTTQNDDQEIVKYTQIDTSGNSVNEVIPSAKITSHELIMQALDSSCASASLATILKYSFNEDVTEEMVVQGILTYGDVDAMTQQGTFSLLDMKMYLEAIGYTAAGYRIVDGISLSQLQRDDFDSIAQVTIIPIEISDSTRLVVFRGYDQDNIYLGDPSMGNICMSIQDFADVISDNVIFVVGPGDTAQGESCILYKTEPPRQGMKIIDNASLAEIL
ncbi:MAG TPA: cysteine peptidase family C39 domain-containing protein [Deltaproteobacteria bacterium]|nr:cysteine peptidase family C39 domain-containing protein [Deltaproteobacteria bacterium]